MTSLREDLITTAVKFLQNPNIQRSSPEKKRNFLLSKGLSDEEIQKAFEKGAAMLGSSTSSSTDLVLYGRHSRMAWLRELLLNIVLFGGITYGIYWIYKRWIESFFFGNMHRRKSPDEQMLDMKNTLEGVMNDLKQEIITVRSEVDRLHNLHNSQSISKSQLEHLKTEIVSVKGILLNRNQFPTLRTEPPSIPAWQLQSVQSRTDASPPQSDHEKEPKEPDDDIVQVRGQRSDSGGSHSSDGEVVTKNSDSSLEIM